MEESVLSLNNIVKDYWRWGKKVRALSGVSFQHKKGSVLGLLGPNGAGKTTLIKLILGLVRTTQGDFKVMGKPKVDRSIKERIGFMPEESYLYPFLTVRETVEFSLRLYKNSKARWSHIDQVLDRVGMGSFKDRRISECSKGMARRTALAQSIVHDPDFVILDEPTSGFDPMGTAEMKEIILDLKNQGKSILLCSHQLADVEDVCDDIVIIMRGQVVVQGALKELLGEGQNDSFVVSQEESEKIKSWLSEEKVSYEMQKSGRLENYFIEKVKAWERE